MAAHNGKGARSRTEGTTDTVLSLSDGTVRNDSAADGVESLSRGHPDGSVSDNGKLVEEVNSLFGAANEVAGCHVGIDQHGVEPRAIGPAIHGQTQTRRRRLAAWQSLVALEIVELIEGRDPHHIAEAEFKAFARAFREAKALDALVVGVPSTKGQL